MLDRERVTTKIAAGLIGGSLSVFGSYIVFEKSVLPIIYGITEERGGITYRANEPISFWISVGLFGSLGLIIAGLGLWSLWQTVRSRRK